MTSNASNQTEAGRGEFYLATVISSSSTAGTKIQLDGESAPMDKLYKRISAVSAGNRVLVLKINGTYIVIGRLTPQ